MQLGHREQCRSIRLFRVVVSNQNVVTMALKMFAPLAAGLKGEFTTHARRLCPEMLHKLKDKKTSTTVLCLEILDAFYAHVRAGLRIDYGFNRG